MAPGGWVGGIINVTRPYPGSNEGGVGGGQCEGAKSTQGVPPKRLAEKSSNPNNFETAVSSEAQHFRTTQHRISLS